MLKPHNPVLVSLSGTSVCKMTKPNPTPSQVENHPELLQGGLADQQGHILFDQADAQVSPFAGAANIDRNDHTVKRRKMTSPWTPLRNEKV